MLFDAVFIGLPRGFGAVDVSRGVSVESTFAGEIEVIVLKSGREVTRVTRPLRNTPLGPVIKFKRRLWRLSGLTIDLDHQPVEDEEQQIEEAAEEPSEMVADADDGLQDAVIHAGRDERLFVDAGPGTGKTFVACSRVAGLINDGLPASRIWIISFTRTAVQEIRNRIATYLNDPSDASAVRIATLDSHAWAIQSGFSADAKLTGSHEDSIEATLRQVSSDEGVLEYLQRVRHLIVDEGQDIVGKRATLVLAIIDRLDDECGVTVFADEAQAIYGFTEDSDVIEGAGTVFIDELRSRSFAERQLKQIHRTSDPGLLEIFTKVRRRVLDRRVATAKRSSDVRSEIQRLASAQIGPTKNLDLGALPDGSLVLLRQRFDVLQTSSFNTGVPHRLRMSGLPPRIYPWIGRLLWDHVDRRLVRSAFNQLWSERPVPLSPIISADAAWELLFEAAGDSQNVIDLHRLRSVLGRSSPPTLFTSPEYGDAGPIIGTIHASKGREAEDVCLFLPPVPEETNGQSDEEIRVMFVGATRAKRSLSVGDSPSRQSGNSDGRAWKRLAGGKLQVEIGRTGDLEPEGLVGTAAFSEAGALAAQNIILTSPVMTGMFAAAIGDLDWKLALRTEEKVRIAVFSEKVKSDLGGIATRCQSFPPPNYLSHVRSTGLRTMVIRPDDPDLDGLHEPWRSSGFLFAPMLTGFGWTKFRGAAND